MPHFFSCHLARTGARKGMATSDRPPGTITIDAKSQRARFQNGPVIAAPISIDDELGPPTSLFEPPVPAPQLSTLGTVPISAPAPAPTPSPGPPSYLIQAPIALAYEEFQFKVHSFALKVPVTSHVIVDEVVHVFAIPKSSPVAIEFPRGEALMVRTPPGRSLDLISSGITFPFQELVFSIFYERPEGGEA